MSIQLLWFSDLRSDLGYADHCTFINLFIIASCQCYLFSLFVMLWIKLYVRYKLLVVFMPSVLWHCWLGIRKSIWPVKIEQWGVGVVICLQRGADCLRMVQLMPLHPKTSSSCASFKSRLALPFWYRLTQVVFEKRLLNGCGGSLSCLRLKRASGL